MTSTKELIQALENTDNIFLHESDRVALQRSLLKALRRTQKPFDIGLEHAWIQPAIIAFVRTLIDVGFWKKWVDAGGKPSTDTELAALTEIDPVLLKRMIRFLSAQELVNDKNGDGSVYELTTYSRALAEPNFPAIYPFFELINQPGFDNLPSFFAATGYKNPVDPAFTNYHQFAEGGFFGLLGSDPKIGKAFNDTMVVVGGDKTSWVDVYPTESIVAAAKPDRALVVDIGGGLGHDLEAFTKKHPESTGLILQDLPQVIASSKVTAPIETQAIDMFKDQPVKGARVYFLKTILHDWPDNKAVEILKTVANSMEKGYSRMLLFESVIATHNANPRTVAQDATMMVCFSAAERDEATWRRIVSDAGLKVTKIWAPEAPDSIIEIEMA